MPLYSGTSKKVVSKNISELQSSMPSAKRGKAIRTYMKNHNCGYDEAKRKLSVVIALNKAGKSKYN